MIETDVSTFPLVNKMKATEGTERESKVLEELMTHQEKVFLICLGFSRNPADAEDLAQEVYLKALRNIDSLTDGNGKLNSYYHGKQKSHGNGKRNSHQYGK